MTRRVLGLAISLLLAAACRGAEVEPTPTPPDLGREDLSRALLNADDAGEAWEQTENPAPNTVQIGGRVGAASIRPTLAEATSAFDQLEGSGYVSDTILLLGGEDVARAVMAAHEEAATVRSWTQDREDGGTAEFVIDGAVPDLPSLGDEMFAARLSAHVTSAEGQESDNTVEYVAFRVGPLVAFVVAQDTPAAALARRLESRVATLLTP